jgi:hypothetical protein
MMKNAADALGGWHRKETLVEWGVVGWDDADVSLDTGLTAEGGLAVVPVQLFRGRVPGADVPEGSPGGVRVECVLSWPLTVPPPRGSRVCVAFPSGDMSAGNGIIFAAVAPSTARLASDVGTIATPDHDLDITPKSKLRVGNAAASKAVATAADLQAILLDVATKLAGLSAPLDPGSLAKIATPPAPPTFAAGVLESS